MNPPYPRADICYGWPDPLLSLLLPLSVEALPAPSFPQLPLHHGMRRSIWQVGGPARGAKFYGDRDRMRGLAQAHRLGRSWWRAAGPPPVTRASVKWLAVQNLGRDAVVSSPQCKYLLERYRMCSFCVSAWFARAAHAAHGRETTRDCAELSRARRRRASGGCMRRSTSCEQAWRTCGWRLPPPLTRFTSPPYDC